MRKISFITVIVLGWCATAMSQTTRQAFIRSFELTPTPPPTPALKYQLLFTDLTDQRAGNAAILYMNSVLLMGPDSLEKAKNAAAAFDAGDLKSFNDLTSSLSLPNVLSELDLAGRCQNCDWETPWRDRGSQSLLPFLSPIRGLGYFLKVTALQQFRQGKLDDSLKTLRLGYELAQKTATDSTLISGLVSLVTTAQMNDALGEIMNDPSSPNLYWALGAIPSCKPILIHGLSSQRFSISTEPELAKFAAGGELSADQWRTVFVYMNQLISGFEGQGVKSQALDPVKDSSPQVIAQTQQYYAQKHNIPLAQAAALDPIIPIGTFFYDEYDIAYDDMVKLENLPYPMLQARWNASTIVNANLQKQHPNNPFLQCIPSLQRAVERFSSVDRQLAALTDVEAIRSYAAANNGKLPQHLEDITETPAMENPMTGKPFAYQVANGVATLSDDSGSSPLKYTISIRK